MTTAGVVTAEYTLPTAAAAPQFITVGPDGALWFTEMGADKIGRITTSGVITEFSVPTPNAAPDVIVAGADGALWFTEYHAGAIGRITTTGVVTEYATSSTTSAPTDIVAGPGGALWFTEYAAGKIGRITTSGVITEYATTAANSQPVTLTVGSDGALWFPEQTPGLIGRMTTAGVLTTYTPTLAVGAKLYDIVAGPDGNLWYTENGASVPANVIGQMTTAGVSTTFTIPTTQSDPQVITAGPDGALWFTEENANNIARLPVTSDPTVLTVTTTDDVTNGFVSSVAELLANILLGGPISLREAVQAIDNTPTTGTPFVIDFDIPGSGIQTINLTSPLPSITQPTEIDATSQPNYTGTPLIELNGSSAGSGANGFVVLASSTTIQGFSICGFKGNGIQVDGVAGTVIQSNYLGLNGSGGAAADGTGIVLTGSTATIVGGSASSDRNIVSGNTTGGIRIESGATGNSIEGNYIGTNVTGDSSASNSGYGIEITASPSNVIGGFTREPAI